MGNQQFRSCIEACHACAVACDNCAVSCLQEEDVKMMARCIALDMDCAQICRMAASLWRGTATLLMRFARYAPTFVRHVVTNAASTRQFIARNARRLAADAPKSAGKWRRHDLLVVCRRRRHGEGAVHGLTISGHYPLR